MLCVGHTQSSRKHPSQPDSQEGRENERSFQLFKARFSPRTEPSHQKKNVKWHAIPRYKHENLKFKNVKADSSFYQRPRKLGKVLVGCLPGKLPDSLTNSTSSHPIPSFMTSQLPCSSLQFGCRLPTVSETTQTVRSSSHTYQKTKDENRNQGTKHPSNKDKLRNGHLDL